MAFSTETFRFSYEILGRLKKLGKILRPGIIVLKKSWNDIELNIRIQGISLKVVDNVLFKPVLELGDFTKDFWLTSGAYKVF